MNFETTKAEILKRAKKADACKEQYQKAYKSETLQELLEVVKNNLRWAYDNMGVNASFLEKNFGFKLLIANHIHTSGRHSLQIKENETYIWVLGNSSVSVETLDNSSANVETLDNSSANVKTWDNSSANVKTWGNSSANVKTLGNSSANVNTLGNSSANVETWGNSSANVKTWGSSSKLTFEVKGDNSFIRHHNERKIYIKKNTFEIVEID